MVNQWGRDGNFSSSGSRASGGGVIVIAALVALLLGAGGGYTAARIFGGASASELRSRDDKIADLEKQVSDLKFTTSGNTSQENILRDKVAELTKANESLKSQIDDNDSKVGADAQAEIAALKKTIEQAGDSRVELNRTRRSLQVAELQIIELEGEIKTQRSEMDKLRKSLTDAANQGDAGDKALGDQIKVLEAALADSRKQAAAAADLRKQLASVNDDLAQKTSDLSTARAAVISIQKDSDKARADLRKARADLAKSSKDLAAALAASKDKGGESEALQKELAATEEQLAGRDADVRTLEARLAEAKQDVDAANAKASETEAQRLMMALNLGSARGEKEKLEGEVAVLKQTAESLRQTIEDLKAAQRKDEPQPDVTTGNDDTPSTRRDANAVKNALEDMPGYNRLTPDKQIELAQRLEDGACAADALKTTLGRVPAIALRNLIRDLGSKC